MPKVAVNSFDKASRYGARLDPLGIIRWLVDGLSSSARFLLWLDTRSLPFPGEGERIGDSVACLDDPDHPEPPWALAIEFQRQPDPRMFGRLLGFLGPLWLHQRPSEERGDRYQVGGVVVNLTDTGRTSRKYQLAGTNVQTSLMVAECNIATFNALAVLENIAAGRVARCVLQYTSLMQGGGEPATIIRWKEVALTEPDPRKRGDYGGLVLVFAELAGCRAQWKIALKEWNMEQSQQVLEWQAEGEVRGEARGELRSHRKLLRNLLEKRFGPLPAEWLARINSTEDLDRLLAAFDKALDIQSLEEVPL